MQNMQMVQARDVNGNYLQYTNGQPYFIPAQHANLQLSLVMDNLNNVMIRNDGAPVLNVMNPITRRLEEYNKNANYGNQNQTQQHTQYASNVNQFSGQPQVSGGVYMEAGASTPTAETTPVATQRPPTQEQARTKATQTMPNAAANLYMLESNSKYKATADKKINGKIAYNPFKHDVYVTNSNNVLVEVLAKKEMKMDLDNHTLTESHIANILDAGRGEGTAAAIIEAQPLNPSNNTSITVDKSHKNIIQVGTLEEAIANAMIDQAVVDNEDDRFNSRALSKNYRYVQGMPIVIGNTSIDYVKVKDALKQTTPLKIANALEGALNTAGNTSYGVICKLLVRQINKVCVVYEDRTGISDVDYVDDFHELIDDVHKNAGRDIAIEMSSDILDSCRELFSGEVEICNWNDDKGPSTLGIVKIINITTVPMTINVTKGLLTSTVMPELYSIVSEAFKGLEVDNIIVLDDTGVKIDVARRKVGGTLYEYYVTSITDNC